MVGLKLDFRVSKEEKLSAFETLLIARVGRRHINHSAGGAFSVISFRMAAFFYLRP